MTTVSILAESGMSECARVPECAQDMNAGMTVFFGVPVLLIVVVIVFFLVRILPRRR